MPGCPAPACAWRRADSTVVGPPPCLPRLHPPLSPPFPRSLWPGRMRTRPCTHAHPRAPPCAHAAARPCAARTSRGSPSAFPPTHIACAHVPAPTRTPMRPIDPTHIAYDAHELIRLQFGVFSPVADARTLHAGPGVHAATAAATKQLEKRAHPPAGLDPKGPPSEVCVTPFPPTPSAQATSRRCFGLGGLVGARGV